MGQEANQAEDPKILQNQQMWVVSLLEEELVVVDHEMMVLLVMMGILMENQMKKMRMRKKVKWMIRN